MLRFLFNYILWCRDSEGKGRECGWISGGGGSEDASSGGGVFPEDGVGGVGWEAIGGGWSWLKAEFEGVESTFGRQDSEPNWEGNQKDGEGIGESREAGGRCWRNIKLQSDK